MQLAEVNISRWKVAPHSAEAKPFIDNIATVNALAERSPGFVWRLLDEGRDARGATPMGGALTLVTLSVWENAEYLEHFVWNTVHKRIYQRKGEWFEALDSHHFAMWWIEDGVYPDLVEARKRLDHLNEHGNSDHAFGWSHLPHIKLWQSQRCA